MSTFETSAGCLELDRLQRWMQSSIAHPNGISSAVASVPAQQPIAVSAAATETIESIETIVTPSATLSAEERLAIYRRSYHARLLECFREMFPALLKALGEKVFDLFALDYLQRHPSRSYTLDHLADDFPKHLAETRPDVNAPTGEREDWPDFLCELATIELAFLKIYDGPGVEGQAAALVNKVSSKEFERIPEVRITFAPCLRLFAFRYPVHVYMLATRRGETPEIPALAASFVAATRKDYQVKLHELTETQYFFLKALEGANRSIGEALPHVESLINSRLPLSTLQNWLSDWSAAGFFESVEIPAACV
jgi:hypothetical protein